MHSCGGIWLGLALGLGLVEDAHQEELLQLLVSEVDAQLLGTGLGLWCRTVRGRARVRVP